LAFKSLLPIQVLIKTARWTTHNLSPWKIELQNSSIAGMASMDLPDAYSSDGFSAICLKRWQHWSGSAVDLRFQQ
jgi:hypothetical protein